MIRKHAWLRRATVLVAAVATAGFAAATPALAEPTGGKTGPVRALCDGPTHKGDMACFALARTDVVGGKGVLAPNLTPNGFGPADLASAYALPSATAGAGQTVAIVDAFDDPNAEADLAVYRAQYGLPDCTTANGCFTKVNQNGQASPLPAPNSGWAGEIALDIQMVSAVCPNCHILLVEATTNSGTDLFTAVNTAVSLGAKFVSNSYGGAEYPTQTSDDDTFFNHPGVAITASSGDSGYGVSYPASSKYVTSVGGTSLSHASNARGWDESAWSGAGSGCSAYDAKPSVQTDPDCPRRTVADVSAVADPQTGVAVYNTYQASGWQVYGGTSVSSPVIASVYALAGTPATASYPNTYPYGTVSALNDVTSGSNGSCNGSYLCTAKSGYDGPTGLGTPIGVRAFAPAGPHGDIAGTVTDAGDGHPLTAATVTAGTASVVTDTHGHYDLSLPVGTYDVSASAYGYASKTVSGVSVADGATTTTDLALAPVPKVSISGTVKDGSGHGWPLYAKVSVAGIPGGPLWTDPATGHYHVDVPVGSAYTLHVTANYPGYAPTDVTIPAGTTDVVQDVSLSVDAVSCSAPGYTQHISGVSEAFESGSTPAGWTVVNNTTGGGWTFTDDGHRGNLTGGDGGFAVVDSDHLGVGRSQDTELRTPVVDLTGQTAPVIGFNSDYRGFGSSTADVDLSLDAGQTWTTVLHQTTSVRGPVFKQIPIPQAAGQATAQVRFRYTGTWAWWWEVDNAYVGTRSCDPVHGGLVLGQVTDRNTGTAVNGATVKDNDDPTHPVATVPTPDDPNLGDGFYWLFSPLTGAHPFTASRGGYADTTTTVNVDADYVTRADFSLSAGHVLVTPGSVSKTVRMGNQTTATVTLRNDGTAPADVQLGERDNGFTILKQQGTGAPLQTVSGSFDMHQLPQYTPKAGTRPKAPVTPYAAPWTDIANYPTPIMDNGVAAWNGKVYSVGGVDGSSVLKTGAVYDPATGAWTAIASMATAREKPAVAVVGDKLYVVGGWGTDGNPVSTTEVYDPAANSWSTAASVPVPYAAAAVSTLGGKLYVLGGCDANVCGHPDVYAYDASANTWSRAADYPLAVSWAACGALSGQLYCAGGAGDVLGGTAKGYSYNPATNAWSPLPDLPIVLWGAGYTGANGVLVISGGVTGSSNTLTNQGYAYDPAARTWTAIANSNNTVYRGGSACGFYKVGGSTGGFNAVNKAEVLPGLDQCGAPADVTWLSETPTSFTVAPGATVSVAVTLDASAAVVTQPGAYAAQLTVKTNTPYQVAPVDVTMNVTPPTSWGKISGTVVGVNCDGTVLPLAGATVQIDTWAAHYTLKTDANGRYALWLDHRNNPLQVIVAKDGWQPQTRQVKIVARQNTTADWKLLSAQTCK
jgi:N-acetylneuraminic acid mutarotase